VKTDNKEDALKQLDQAVECIRIAKRRARSGNIIGASAELDIARTIIDAAKEEISKLNSDQKGSKAKS
jgi:hypothetical protein